MAHSFVLDLKTVYCRRVKGIHHNHHMTEVSNAEMRSAYEQGKNEQLGQVMEWLEEHLESYTWAGDPGIHTEGVIIGLKQAMRPTNTQEDS